MKISVCLSTRRYGGLLRQIEFFKNQTFPKQDFELLIVDGLYWQREDQIKEKANDCGLNLVYKKPRKLDRKVSIDHPSMRNDGLVHATGELIVFFDDYQIPSKKLLEEHWRIHEMGYCCQGRQYFFDRLDFDNVEKVKSLRYSNVQLGDAQTQVNPSVFYTHNCSAPLDELVKINGFDERYNSGTGGEDYDCGMRLGLTGNEMMYNPNAVCYHMDHGNIGIYPATPDLCGHIFDAKTRGGFLERYPTMSERDIEWITWDDIGKYASNDYKRNGPKFGNHDRSPIYKHPNFTGQFSTSALDTWDENGVIFCKCKICGWEGVIDSIPLFHWNSENKNSEAPKKYFDLAKARNEI